MKAAGKGACTMHNEFEQMDKEYIVNVYNRLDAVLDHGKGSVLYDVDGKEYIVNQGESLVMPAKKPHSVHAVEAFKMMLVVVFPLEQD